MQLLDNILSESIAENYMISGITCTRISDHFSCFIGFKLRLILEIKRNAYVKQCKSEALQHSRAML